LGGSNPRCFYDWIPSNYYCYLYPIPFSDGSGSPGYYRHTYTETFWTFWQAEGTGRESLKAEIPNDKFQTPNNFKIQNTKSKMKGKNPPTPPLLKGGGGRIIGDKVCKIKNDAKRE
jgi:hypothetical protein